MYHTQSLLEAYYSIYNNKMSDNEMYEIVENYLLENYEFYSQEQLDEMISLLDEETIEAIIIEGLKDMSPEDRERWIKSQPDPELARKKLQKYESRGEDKEEKSEREEPKKDISFTVSRDRTSREKRNIEYKKPEAPQPKTGREAFYDAIRKATR